MSAGIVDDYLETPMEADDAFPCKGCGEILEEGKAFELAGNRWHLDCFRCTTCGSLLDSDANLLLLGDGSLICNNCTYSCTACGNKIEDLAILTGDQAFCSTCFRCRNCKRKIENLRYARTSQGIFCMDCYETLMARRRKKSKAAAAAKAREKDPAPTVPEKSLPALPPGAIPNNAFSDDRVDPEGPTELSPRPRTGHRHNESSSRGGSKASRSPERAAADGKDGLSLPSTTYRRNRNSTITSNNGDGGDGFMISVALDTGAQSPNGTPKESASEAGKKKDKDQTNAPRPTMSDKRVDSHSSATHIAFLGAAAAAAAADPSQPKPASRSASKSDAKASSSADDIKLQDAPKKRRPTESRSDSPQSVPQQHDGTPSRTGTSTPRKDSTSQASDLRRAMDDTPGSRSSYDSKEQDDGEIPTVKIGPRSDSMNKSIPRKEVPSASTRSVNGSPSAAQGRSSTEDATASTPRRPGATERVLTDTYMQPRAAPVPPSSQTQSPPKEPAPPVPKGAHASPSSPKLPRWSSGADFTMDEDMVRILGADEGSSSILRRVSNAVRHGRTSSVESSQNLAASRGAHTRSISETTHGAISPRWPKTQDEANGQAQDVGSPASLHPPDSATLLKQQLRSSEQRVAELERQFGAEKDLLSINQKLIEKRKTVSVLDTQTEIMIRQLEVLAGYVERAKETQAPIDVKELEESAIKEFVEKLEKVKQSFTEELERLHEERDQLVEEKNQAATDRDRALMEFEQLSSKNAQLADMNNDLTHQIQERFKSQISTDGKSHGLGIYKGGASSINLDTASVTTGTTLVPDEDPTIVEHGPTVVHVRKGQVKKFNWKKGSKTMAQNITKGVGRAVVAFQNDRERMQQQGMVPGSDNIGIPYNMTVAQNDAPNAAASNHPAGRQHQQQFGFFGKKNASAKTGLVAPANIVVAQAAPEPPSTLFGSELAERCEYEHRQIPSVVTRCIEEVELRGMDQEGIYRKTGGNSQINQIKEGFDKDEDYDISDPDLDITAVTSVLKQYFRKLPNPLLTFDIYEKVLESNSIIDEAERCSYLHKVFTSMPQSHRDCLEFLMFHLHRVAIREPENLMSPKNLAVVFAPTIMRDLSIEREMTDMHNKNLAVQFVIENTHRIFEDE
ncbi:RhoGAP domain-containing protein [Trichoderma novae-zelandiae]